MSLDPVIQGSIIYVVGNRAAVSLVHSSDRVEVVYLSQSGVYVAEDAVLADGRWQFEAPGACATYAERSPRLQLFVSILKRGA